MKRYWFLWVVAAMLIAAFGSWPYGYYQLLRWVVAGTAAYMAYINFNSGKQSWAWVFTVVAVLFNPVVPFTMARESWQLFDIAAAVPFAAFPFSKHL